MNKKNFIKGTTLPVALFFTIATFAPAWGLQTASAAIEVVQQQSTIKGTVVDSQGEPIIGASVLAEGTSNGTITDIDGVFRINVRPGAKLKVSFIGYTDKKVVAKNDMKVILVEDVTALEEVEIVAYGTQKKVTMTGAIASVKGEELTRVSVGSVSNVLGGQMTGLTTVQYSGEPGADAAEIFIRGKATWENSSPLIQVDGVDRESMSDIDPNEIESISILKDASATAVFGIRGANGVILITTKRGKEGKAKISFTTSASVLMPTKMVEQASSYDYARFHNQMMSGDGKSALFSDGVIQKFADGSDPIRFPNIQWADYIMKSSTLQSQHNLNISGGTDKVRYFISAGAYTQGGLFSEFDLPYNLSYQYRRFNYRTNLDMDVTKTTTLSFNISGNVNNSDQPRTSQGSSGLIKNMYYATPFSSPGIIDGKLVNSSDETYSDGLKLPFTGGTGMGYYGNGFSQTSNNSLNVDVILDQKMDFLTKGLSFKVKGSYNSSFTVNKVGSGGSIATYTPVLMDDGSIAYRKFGENTDVKYSYTTGKARNWYMEASFNYNRTFGDHTVTALVLYNQQKEYYPKVYSDIPHGYVGLVGRVTYDWKSRYMAEFNVGYNGSENFASDLRFSYFPAGSIGWVMSEELATQVDDTAGCYVVPAFTGLGAPYWDSYARGTIVGLTRGVNKKHIVRATLDSIAYQVADVLAAMNQDSGIHLQSLNVDGGASANNYLMQTQADIIQVPVRRPVCVESTALGAAYLAGLAVSYWKDMDEIRSNAQIERIFEPQITEEEKNERVRGWEKAVRTSFDWAKGE